jgi:ABC-2 type transport system permease protein
MMNTDANAIRIADDPSPAFSLLRTYVLEARYEFLRVLRTPAFAVPTLLFPPLFYLLFGLLLNRANSGAAHYLFATYSVFGVMAPSLFGFGVAIAIERERGWLALKRVAPMPPGAYLIAKMAMAMLFAAIIYAVLAAMAHALGGVRLAPAAWAALALVAVLGVLPFCALGLLIGSRANASAAPAFVNLIYLPMAFLSGLWMPLSMLPAWIGKLAPLWPAYHLARLGLAAVGQGSGDGLLADVAALGAFTLLCFAVARRRFAKAG